MESSEPDTVFFRDCLEYVIGSNPDIQSYENAELLAFMDENRSLLPPYLRWFKFYRSICAYKKGKAGNTDSDGMMVRLNCLVLMLHDAQNITERSRQID